jgi:drug/metabolite transporter (DMT)-like permease
VAGALGSTVLNEVAARPPAGPQVRPHAQGPALGAFAPLILTMILWGSAFAASSLAIDAVGHEVAASLRYGIAAIVMVGVLAVTGRGAPPLSRRTWVRLVLAGAVGIAIYNRLFFQGLALAPAIDGSSTMPVMSPVFTAALVTILARERPTPRRLAALATGLSGAVLFLLSAPVDGDHPQRLLGDLFYLGAAFCWAVYTLMGRRLMTLADPFRVSTWAMVFGSLMLTAVALPELGHLDWAAVPGNVWLGIGYLALLPTALGYALFYRGVRDVGPTTASMMMFLVPVFGALGAMLLLGESLHGLQLLGAVTMAAGAFLAIISTGSSRAR